jgi:polysaccharide deacetylase 2 family uncharacterized protein YibQ
MPTNELTRPLGLSPPPPPRRPRYALFAVVALVAAGAVGAGVWLTRPPAAPAARPAAAAATTATAQIKPAPDTSIVTAAIPATSPRPAATVAPSAPRAPGDTGLTPLTPNGSLAPVGKVVIYDPTQPTPLALPSVPDTTLVEAGAYGPLPKTSADGRRPLDVYARPAQGDGGARIAIVVGSVGIDSSTTASAIASLPGAVTLALAPYGTNLKQTLASARAAGHELLLQIPLEPYGYPQTDPGPHTLTVDGGGKANLDNLSWLLSRTTDYVGVVNYMGARFTSDTQSMTGLLDAVGQRGLLYLDDGSSPRSLAATVAPGHAPFLQADLVLDPDLTPAAIDARLDQLVAIARMRGYAVATASAFPATIDRIAAFAKTAAAKNITLVPVSALVSPASHS